MDGIFQGFEERKKQFGALPDQFFSELLPAIEDINELKTTIYLLWSAYKQGDYGLAFRVKDLMLDEIFLEGLQGGSSKEELAAESLRQAAARGSLIQASDPKTGEALFFINSPRGRAAAELLRQGRISSEGVKPTLEMTQPNIYRLYEENIGPLTPILADSLRDAQQTYPEEWISEAIQLAVKNNVRRWKYVESILKRWQEEGRDGTHRRDDQEDHRRYLKGEYGEIGQH